MSVSLGGHKLHIHLGWYPTGELGEVSTELHKVGTFSRSMVYATVQLMSLSLQHGVEPQKLVEMFRRVDFEPQGEVKGHATITSATSVLDLLAQIIDDETKKSGGG